MCNTCEYPGTAPSRVLRILYTGQSHRIQKFISFQASGDVFISYTAIVYHTTNSDFERVVCRFYKSRVENFEGLNAKLFERDTDRNTDYGHAKPLMIFIS